MALRFLSPGDDAPSRTNSARRVPRVARARSDRVVRRTIRIRKIAAERKHSRRRRNAVRSTPDARMKLNKALAAPQLFPPCDTNLRRPNPYHGTLFARNFVC